MSDKEFPFYPPQPRLRKQKPRVICPESRDKHPPSLKSTNVIFLGAAGTGKTTTINALFSLCPAPDTQTEEWNSGNGTQKIIEFTSTNNKLKIIDTPGLGSLYCLQWDARIIASLKNYIDKTNIGLRNSIPHVVVITHKFDDDSFHQLNSNLGRCLQAINTLNQRLFSSEYCNLIVLLTHFMSAKKIHRDNPNVKIQMVRDLVRKTLNKSCHVILGENDAENWGLPKSNLRMGYRLPGAPINDIYPNNLDDLIQEVINRAALESTTNIFEEREICLTKSLELITTNSKRYQKAYEAIQWAYGNITVTL